MEEEVIFPAIRSALPESTREEMLREMQGKISTHQSVNLSETY
jgi:hemerythrin superfamily protein